MITRLFTIVNFVMLSIIVTAQDVGVVNILSPNNGCDIQYPQTVTIEVRNFSNIDLTLPISLSYQLNSEPIVTQDATLTIGSGGTITFTFAVPIGSGLIYGTNTIVSTATNPLDGNNSNDTFTKSFVNDLPTIPGNVLDDASYCDTINMDSVMVVGYQGAILNWQSSINNGASWTDITNTTTILHYLNVNTTTLFRAHVKSGSCNSVYSQAATIEINEKPTLPLISHNGPVCLNTALQLSASSIDRATYTWYGPNSFESDEQNPSFIVSDSSSAGLYYVYASIGDCVGDTANFLLEVATKSEGGMASGAKVVCQEENKGSVGLVGNIGDVMHWEYSENNGTDWVVLGASGPTKSYENITQDRDYRAFVKNGTCPGAYSTPAKIRVTYDDCRTVVIANLLTPNGDDKNDTWLIDKIDENKVLSVEIYSRAGVLVYESKDYKNDWDGTYNGEKLQDGTYFYLLKENGTNKKSKGTLNLMR